MAVIERAVGAEPVLTDETTGSFARSPIATPAVSSTSCAWRARTTRSAEGNRFPPMPRSPQARTVPLLVSRPDCRLLICGWRATEWVPHSRRLPPARPAVWSAPGEDWPPPGDLCWPRTLTSAIVVVPDARDLARLDAALTSLLGRVATSRSR